MAIINRTHQNHDEITKIPFLEFVVENYRNHDKITKILVLEFVVDNKQQLDIALNGRKCRGIILDSAIEIL